MAFNDLSDEERETLRNFLGLDDDEDMTDDDLEDEADYKRDSGSSYMPRRLF